MVKPIVHDTFFLSRKSAEASAADKQTAKDLADTLKAHEDGCVGMAANMIGVSKRIIAVQIGAKSVVMFNPVIVSHSQEQYEAVEGCLSLKGERNTMRYESLELEYRDMDFKFRRGKFSGFTAQIIQHEIDHLNGILI